nr:MAG TPA: hypothetical protein [Caudoviricetes sp.]
MTSKQLSYNLESLFKKKRPDFSSLHFLICNIR